jgi:hypothetical protein
MLFGSSGMSRTRSDGSSGRIEPSINAGRGIINMEAEVHAALPGNGGVIRHSV